MSTLKFPPFGKDWPAGEEVRLNTHENADEDEDDTDQEVEGVMKWTPSLQSTLRMLMISRRK